MVLAETWDGTTWAIDNTPSPAGSTLSELGAVACPSPRACVAVGNFTDRSGAPLTLAAAWNGGSWAVPTAPDPNGSATSALYGVSCREANRCTAVGTYTNSSGTELTLAEVWNGSTWSIQRTPNPEGTLVSSLYGVSCPAANACTAVGAYTDDSGRELTLAEVWNGTSWDIQATPNPSGASVSALAAISCSAPAACTAVGGFTNSLGTQVTLAESRTAGLWTIGASPDPAGAASSDLYAVSCRSPTACNASGYYTTRSGRAANTFGTSVRFGEAWDGVSWGIADESRAISTMPGVLHAVSCVSANVCTGVGGSAGSGRTKALAEQWNGTGWTAQSTPNPSAASSSNLYSVSCSSATACTAVGTYTDVSGTVLALAEGEQS